MTDNTTLKPFKREERYIVVKIKDHNPDSILQLRDRLDELAIGTTECVVVESDWPEYETVWAMIEARCNGNVETGVTQADRLWLWQNFVDGKPEYWAFDNGYPCHENGDPITLGNPVGWAVFKPSKNGRPEVGQDELERQARQSTPLIEAVKDARADVARAIECGSFRLGAIGEQCLNDALTKLDTIIEGRG